MKIFLSTIALSLTFLSSIQGETHPAPQPSAQQQTQPQAKPDQKIDVQFSFEPDGRHWNLGDETKNDQMSLQRYVLDGETVELWTELFTVHKYYGIKGDVSQFFDHFLSALQGMVPKDTKIEHKVISQDKNNLLGEWWIPTGLTAQHEWIRVITEGDNVIVLRYTTRKLKSVDDVRPTWEGILKNAKVVKKDK